MLRSALASLVVLAACAFGTGAVGQARGETAEEFFRGRQLSLIVGYNPGGSYDAYARIAANYLPRFIPGNC